MTDAQLAADLVAIRAEANPVTKHLRVASLVSELFREEGADPIVVGGSAVEFYTEGAYVSGDIDICFAGAVLPETAPRVRVMTRAGAQALSSRRFVLEGTYIDLFGAVETSTHAPFQEVGSVKLQPLEELVSERLYAAFYFPVHSPEQEAIARVLLQAALSGGLEVDEAEMRRVAASSAYGVDVELDRLTIEVQAQTRGSENRRRGR